MNSLAVKEHEANGKRRTLLGAKLTVRKKHTLLTQHSRVVILLLWTKADILAFQGSTQIKQFSKYFFYHINIRWKRGITLMPPKYVIIFVLVDSMQLESHKKC